MQTTDSVTQWIVALKSGDEDAARRLWDRYFNRLAGLARERLPGNCLYSEEDVAISVFDVFCRMVKEDHALGPTNRDELWRMLSVIAVRKVRQRLKGELAQKRGGLLKRNAASIDELAASMPPPDISVMMSEECQRLIAALGDPKLESLVSLKLDGYTNEEISAKMQCSRWTVQRRIRLIQDIWRGQIEEA